MKPSHFLCLGLAVFVTTPAFAGADVLARDSATNTAKLAPGFALRAEFRDRYADWGRDLVLYLGQRRCGRKLKESGALAGGIDYGSVSGAIRRLEKSDQHQKLMRKLLQQALRQIEND